jgi:hypothetical protein
MQEELKKINDAVDVFAEMMKAKMKAQAEAGWRGWNDPRNREAVRARLSRATNRIRFEGLPEEVDLANLAMMLEFQRTRTDPSVTAGPKEE